VIRLQDHYAALGISSSASEKDIKLAYFKTERSCHPDVMKNSSETAQAAAKKKWQAAANAYEVFPLNGGYSSSPSLT